MSLWRLKINNLRSGDDTHAQKEKNTKRPNKKKIMVYLHVIWGWCGGGDGRTRGNSPSRTDSKV